MFKCNTSSKTKKILMNFDVWYSSLIADERWYEFAGKNHKPETFRKVAEQVYTLGLSDSHNFEIQPLREHRNHVVNKLNKILPDKVKIDWTLKALEKQKVEEKAKELPPVSWEKRAEYLQKIQDILKESRMVSAVPRVSIKEAIEEGGWLPKKEAPYPITSLQEAYIKNRHFEYIKQNYEPRTGAKLPGWVLEDQFNEKFDLENEDLVTEIEKTGRPSGTN